MSRDYGCLGFTRDVRDVVYVTRPFPIWLRAGGSDASLETADDSPHPYHRSSWRLQRHCRHPRKNTFWNTSHLRALRRRRR
ncbi:hypothetical protein BDZ89DRAFT_1075963, partial [Hymenopellis radicata]